MKPMAGNIIKAFQNHPHVDQPLLVLSGAAHVPGIQRELIENFGFSLAKSLRLNIPSGSRDREPPLLESALALAPKMERY